jgi:hypothetical protein
MKKHLAIISIVIASTIIFLLAFVDWNDVFSDPVKQKQGSDNIDQSIESFGKLPWNKSTYEEISNSIVAMSSSKKINDTRKKALMSSLEYAKQDALVLSLNKWLANSCSHSDISAIVKEARNCTEPSQKLQELLQSYAQYNAALSHENKLYSFLQGPFSESAAQGLISNYARATSGKPFSSCNKIGALRTKINDEINIFQKFHNNFKGFCELKKFQYISLNYDDELNKYRWYRQELERLDSH